MRTLFLIGILVTLAVIAIKEPGETGLEAARGLAHEAADVATEIREAVEAVPEVSMVLGNKLEDNNGVDREFTAQVDSALSDISEAGQTLVNTEPGINDSLRVDVDEDDEFGREVNTIREEFTSLNDLPPIESAPVTPVTTEYPVTEPLSPPSHSGTPEATPVFAGDDFAEVKDFYENASRLLAEME